MLIRRAEERDIPRIHELLAQVAQVHHTGRPDLFRAGGRKYTDTQLSQKINDENTPIFVLTDGTEWAADGWGGGQGDGGYWYNSYRCEDKRPLNPADVVGLRIGENVYPLTLE